MDNPYGFCPECGQPGTIRARDFVATTFCANKHGWIPMKGVAISIYHAFVNGANFVRTSNDPHGGRRLKEVEDKGKEYQARFEEGLK